MDQHPKRIGEMANANTIQDVILADIARQIRERLVVEDSNNIPIFSFESLSERGAPSTSALLLVETLEVWRLSPIDVSKFEKGISSLGALAKRTKLWHHQIKLDNDCLAFARSA